MLAYMGCTPRQLRMHERMARRRVCVHTLVCVIDFCVASRRDLARALAHAMVGMQRVSMQRKRR